MIIDQLFTRPIFEAADPNRLIATITLAKEYNADEPTKEIDLTGRFQGDVKSQMNQAADYLTQFLQSKGFNFTSIQLKYQGMVMNAQNRGAMAPQSDWEKEAEATANQMRAKRPVQNTAPALKEFAPGDDDDSNGSDPEELLRRMAAHWWNGTEKQMAKVENTLAAMGWEIGQDEGYDDGGVFVVRAGDEHGDSYISWPHEDLELNEGRKKKKKKTSKSLGRYFFPGYGYYGSGESGEGGGDGGGGESANPGMAEAAQGHTIEAHGVRGMDRRTWHKTFRNTDQMIAWAEKHDAEIMGTRDLEQSRHGNLSHARQGVAEGLTEMDKSEPSAGRDGVPRSGPDKEAKPISKEKMVKHALDTLSKSMAKKDNKKKDVSEAYPLGYSTDPAQGKWYQEGMDAVKYGTVGNSIKEIAKKHFVPPQWLEAFTAGFRQQEEWSREGAARGFPGGQKPEPYTTSKAMSVPPTFQPNTNARGGGGMGMNPDPLAQLMRESGIGSEPLMKKLRAALIREGRVKELADDLKTMSDADFMKKYGKTKAAIRADMKRVDEAGISRLGKKDFDFRDGLVGDDETGVERQNEPELGMFRMGKPVEPNDAATKEFMAAFQGAGQQNADNSTPLEPGEFRTNDGRIFRFVTDPAAAPAKKEVRWIPSSEADSIASWKANNPGKSAADSAAASKLPKMRFDRASNSLVPVDATPVLDQSPNTKDKFDSQTRSVKPADGSGANANIDAATRDRARAWAAQQNAPGAALAGAMRSSGTPVATAKNKTDWKTIYNLNKAIIGSNPNLIRPGMKLKMPNGSTYSVQSGDTLSKIAAGQINELSTEKLAQYKTAAAADAKKADQEGDVKRGDKRFSGIVKATKKQFDNDAKQVDESRAARRALMAQIVNHR